MGVKTVRSILKNEKYIGDAILQKKVTVDTPTTMPDVLPYCKVSGRNNRMAA